MPQEAPTKLSKLGLTDAIEALRGLKDKTTGITQQRIDNLLVLSQYHGQNQRPILVSDIYTQVFAGESTSQAKENFNKFRKALSKAAENNGVQLELKADGQKKLGDQRPCYFYGLDPQDQALTRFSEQGAIAKTNENSEPSKGTPIKPKTKVKFFISYAHANDADMATLLRELNPHLNTDKDYDISLWQDTHILLGANFHADIQQAIEDSDFGLFLISPEFFSSDYIRNHEIPHYIDDLSSSSSTTNNSNPQRIAIPVGLKSINFSTCDSKGVGEKQIFLHKGKFFSQVTSKKANREDFALTLYRKIRQRLDHTRIFKSTQQDSSKLAGEYNHSDQKINLADNANNACIKSFIEHSIPQETPFHSRPRGTRAKLDGDTTSHNIRDNNEDAALDVQADLRQWVIEKDHPFYALLGDLGMGKTTNCKKFAQTLNADSTLPYPTPSISIYAMSSMPLVASV